jgi:hypothetical protein
VTTNHSHETYARLAQEIHGFPVEPSTLQSTFKTGILSQSLIVAFAAQSKLKPQYGVTSATPVQERRKLCLEWWTEVRANIEADPGRPVVILGERNIRIETILPICV